MKSRNTLHTISQYDKIVKENLEAAIPALIERLLNIQAVESDELPDARSVGPAAPHKRT
jgi:hypothetical protein